MIELGECTRGDQCRFEHSSGGEGGGSFGGGGGYRPRDGGSGGGYRGRSCELLLLYFCVNS